jgi:peptidoglycan/LPS O-acetylase OafA/YrhL
MLKQNLAVDDAYQSFRKTKTFGALNGFRGIAVLMVIWHHTTSKLFAGIQILHLGYLGVEFFFVISGFLITTLLLREKTLTGSISLKHFYIRRVLRIFPIYYTIIIVYVIVVNIFERGTPAGLGFMTNLKYYLTYTSNWFVELDQPRVIFYLAWSLATEEQFYMVWPSVEKFLKERWVILFAVGMILISTFAALGVFAFVLPFHSLPTMILKRISVAICLGVLLAHIFHSRRSFAIAYKFLGYRWSCIIMLVGLIAALQFQPRMGVMNLNLVFVMMMLLIGSCVIREDHWLAKPMAWPPLALVGLLSYGIYLMHMLCFHAVILLSNAVGIHYKYIAFPLTTLLVVGMSWVSFTYFESYFLKLKAKFSRVA